MSQVWHLFRNDLRASKNIRAVWFGSIAVYAAFALQDPLAAHWALYGPALGVLTTVVAVVCAALLVQQDSLVGPRPFWMTRPVSRWAQLASKLLFLLTVFVCSHTVLCSATLLRFGVSVHELPSLLAAGSWHWPADMAIGAALATLTAGAAQFIAASLLVYIATLGALLAVFSWVGSGTGTVGLGGPDASLFILALSSAVILLRYGRLSRVRVVGFALVGWGAFVVLGALAVLDPDEAVLPAGQWKGVEIWGATDLDEDATVQRGDYAVRVESIAIDAEKATIVAHERRIFRGVETAVWPKLAIVHGPSGAERSSQREAPIAAVALMAGSAVAVHPRARP